MPKQKEIVFERKSLREWIELEEARSKIKEIFKTKDGARVAQSIFAYIQLAGEDREYEKLDCITALQLYSEAFYANSPHKQFPILKYAEAEKDKLPWEYDGRAWYFWANLFSTNYGWTLDYIAQLDIDDAIGLYQEIEIEQQLRKEWDWGLSEIAYPYDKSSKSSKFQPLSRPKWMLPIAPKPKIVKIRKDLLPIGNVVADEKLTEAVDASRTA